MYAEWNGNGYSRVKLRGLLSDLPGHGTTITTDP